MHEALGAVVGGRVRGVVRKGDERFYRRNMNQDTTTFAPRLANCGAVARQLPRDAPQMTTTCWTIGSSCMASRSRSVGRAQGGCASYVFPSLTTRPLQVASHELRAARDTLWPHVDLPAALVVVFFLARVTPNQLEKGAFLAARLLVLLEEGELILVELGEPLRPRNFLEPVATCSAPKVDAQQPWLVTVASALGGDGSPIACLSPLLDLFVVGRRLR